MNRPIKFRAWHPSGGTDESRMKMTYWKLGTGLDNSVFFNSAKSIMQFTGLLDKNGLKEVYEGDIIDVYGNIKGNIYEMDKGEADLVIEGLGTATWTETEKAGLGRGLTYTERDASEVSVR